jgi:hypothetical protein
VKSELNWMIVPVLDEKPERWKIQHKAFRKSEFST